MIPSVEVHAVASRNPENAKQFASHWNIPVWYANVEELCEDPDIYSVHICNANVAHGEAIRFAVQNGKAILCEKPLAHNQAVTNDVFQWIQKYESLFSVCYSYRYHPATLLLARHLPEIGAILKVDISYLQSSWLKKRKESWKPNVSVYGESYVLGDIGSHAIDMAQYLLQKPLIFQEAVIQYDGKILECSDIAATVQLRSDDDIPVAINVSKSSKDISNQFKIRFFGEHGELGVEHLLEERVYLVNEQNKRWINRTPDLEFDVLKFPEEHSEGWLAGFVNLFSSFYQRLAGEKTLFPLPTVNESVQITNLIGDILQRGHWEPIAT